MISRERHHDPIHEKVNSDPVHYPGDNWLPRHEPQFPACTVKYAGGREGDQEMESSSKRRGLPTISEGFRTKQSARDPT